MNIIHPEFPSNNSEAKELNLDNIQSRLPTEIMSIIREYYQLRVLPNLSDEQLDRIGEILDLATDNEGIDAWITEIDHALGHRIGLLSQDCRRLYENQRAVLKEHLEVADLCKQKEKATQQSVSRGVFWDIPAINY